MSDTNINGGPAFPFACQGPTTAPETYYGMTLLDYFAGMAMQAMLSAPPGKFKHSFFKEIASDAYEMADEMLKARKKNHEYDKVICFLPSEY